jgi:hypothetical protein
VIWFGLGWDESNHPSKLSREAALMSRLYLAMEKACLSQVAIVAWQSSLALLTEMRALGGTGARRGIMQGTCALHCRQARGWLLHVLRLCLSRELSVLIVSI